jgi:prephenate dehydrogenase
MNEDITSMKESVIRILKNHKQSTVGGLHQITGGDQKIWNGIEWVVYKLKKNNLS